MKTCAAYIADAKARLGNSAMSDRELGEKLGGFIQSNVARAKAGYMTDPMALRLADVLGIEAGEVLMVARLEREKDPAVRAALERWAGKVFASLPATVAASLAVMAAVLSGPCPSDAAAAIRGNSASVMVMSTMRRLLRRLLQRAAAQAS